MSFLNIEHLGPLYSFDPNIFIPDEKEMERDVTVLKVCQFFLMLSLIYNDLRDLIMIVIHMENEKPKSPNKMNKHAGQYGGMYNHIDKLVLSLFCELMESIKKSQEVLKHDLYLRTIRNISKESREKWFEIVDIALNVNKKDQKYSNFKVLKDLYTRVRHRVGSHYDIEYDDIIKGYKYMFEDVHPDMRCYISMGTNMAQRRFYFADCVVSGLKHLSVGSNVHKVNYRDIVERINHPIYDIISRFITVRKGSLRAESEEF